MKKRSPQARGDNEDVARSASMLQISEFELFQLAYRSWYGQTPTELQLTRAFDAYMVQPRCRCGYARFHAKFNICKTKDVSTVPALGFSPALLPDSGLA